MLAPSVKKIPSQIVVKIGIGKMKVPSGEKILVVLPLSQHDL